MEHLKRMQLPVSIHSHRPSKIQSDFEVVAVCMCMTFAMLNCLSYLLL